MEAEANGELPPGATGGERTLSWVYFIRLAVVASQTCQLAQKLRENMNLQQFKVIRVR